MAEAEVFGTEEEFIDILEEKHSVSISYTRGAEKPEDESYSFVRPLLQHNQQDSCDEKHKGDRQTVTDGADQMTSVPHDLRLADRDQPSCSGSVRSLCSDSRRRECPICSEPFDSHGEHRITLLNCNHTLCHHCIAGIMRRAKNQSRLQCPFCRQTTPFPQWEIRMLQEESYSSSIYEPRLALVISPGPELQASPASLLCCFTVETHTQRNICARCVDPSCLIRGLRLMRGHSLCFSITALLLVFLVLLGCFLYMVVPVTVVSVLLSNG